MLDTSTTILTTRLTGFRRGFRLRSTYAHYALTTERADQPIRSGRPGLFTDSELRYLHTPWARVLTTTGRKTGQQRRNYVRAIRRQDKVYVVMLRPPALAIERPLAVSSWVWNMRGNPNIRLRLRRRTCAGVAREISDPTELQQAREAICETVHLIDYGECRLHLRGRPSRTKIKDLHRY
ncbi:nitroreductase/quinone reductase family protein [Rhodococcus opacus]|uniref:nitroreductase/quinone reductase family protein n=1 Tax=Rhodococcus opacus TaxID=37919 RepID=UPI001E43234E|nr:nitroreductase/quinone reductase family protein [Rhodococcus opacus]